MAATGIPAEIQAGLRYGPQTQSAIQRSRYLAEALQAMQKGSEQIATPTELWTKLLASAIMSYGKDKADRAAITAVKDEQSAYAKALLEGLNGPGEASAAPATSLGPPSAPQPQTAPGPQLALAMTPPGAGPQGPAGMTPDRAKALVSEIVPGATFTSGYRTPAHNAEVGGAQNSFHTRGDGQAWDFVPPQGADLEKFRAELQARGAPVSELLNEGDHWHWAFGQGQGQGQAAPVDYAQLAASAPGQPPAAPPPAGGAAATPAASVPQAAAGVATMGPTPQQRALAEQLLNDPRTYEQGVAYVMKLRQQMAEAVKWENTSINGLPYQVNPYTGERRAIALPEGAMTQVQTAQQAGVATAPPGTYLQRDPLGNLKDVPGGTPPQGYGVQGQGYAPIQGGPADPRRGQPPATGYQYQGGGQQPIPGGPADPRNPQAILAGTETVRRELAPIIDAAQRVSRNYAAVQVGFAQQNGAGDNAMINGLQKIVDEGVVREADVALALKAQGLAGSVAGIKGYLTSEGFFADPAVRLKVKKVADQLYEQINGGYRDRVTGYRPIVDNAYGPGTFERYVLTPEIAASVGWGGPAAPAGGGGGEPTAPPQFKPGSADAGLALAIQRGLFNRLSPAQQKRARDLGLVK